MQTNLNCISSSFLRSKDFHLSVMPRDMHVDCQAWQWLYYSSYSTNSPHLHFSESMRWCNQLWVLYYAVLLHPWTGHPV